MRVTSPRLAILDAIKPGQHPSVDEITNAVRDRLGTITVQAVYDALGAFTAAGLLRRIEPAGSAARYENRVGDNHHHLVCRQCGKVVDVDCAVGHAPCLEPAADAGFAIDEAEVTFWGLCADCQVSLAQRPAHS
jgi:Fur family ferric uptake transcriptional regulator